MRAAARLNLPALRRPPQKSYTGLRALALKWPPDHNAGCAFFSRARAAENNAASLAARGRQPQGGPLPPLAPLRRNLGPFPRRPAETSQARNDFCPWTPQSSDGDSTEPDVLNHFCRFCRFGRFRAGSPIVNSGVSEGQTRAAVPMPLRGLITRNAEIHQSRTARF
jgi:hypothetical protein